MAIKNDFVVKHGLTVTNTATINQDLIVVGSIKKNGVDVGYGYTGSQGIQGNIGYTGSQGVIGYTGSKGDSGLGFTIAKTYASVAELTADTTPTGIVAGQFALIDTGDVENPENSRLYLWNGSSYQYTSDLSGAQGITGPQGVTGYTGSAGPTNLINSTGFNDSANHGFLYLVGVGETGVNSTASSLVSVPIGIDTANEALVVGGTAADMNSTLTVNSPYGQTQVSVVSPAGRRSSSGIKLKTGDSTSTDLIQYSDYFGIESLASPLFFAPGPGNNITLRNDGCVINSQGIDTTPLATLDVRGSLYTYGTATINRDLIVTGSIKKNGIDVGYGYTGSQGIQGVIGYTGSQGIQGVIGYTGSRGATGFTGSQGIQGPIGYTGSASSSVGSAPQYACRAWGDFSGVGSVGTYMTVYGSGNIASVYKNGIGDYTITFTTAMPDNTYGISVVQQADQGNSGSAINITTGIYRSSTAKTSSSVRVITAAGGSNNNPTIVSVAVFC